MVLEATSTASSFVSGAISGACTTILFQPFDLIKTRMQAETIRSTAGKSSASLSNIAAETTGMLGTARMVIESESLFALWRGVSPSLQRCIPSVGVYFATLHFLNSTVLSRGIEGGKFSAMQALVTGSCARGFASSIFLPLTVVKARYESGWFPYRSVPHALVCIWRTEGISGLYGGLSATLSRDVPFSGLFFMFYSQSTQALRRRYEKDSLPVLSGLLCGILSGLTASTVTQPFDVIKTRMQLSPVSSRNLWSTAGDVVRIGPREMFRGLVPRMARRTLMATFTWAFYEQISRHVSDHIR